MLSTKGMEARSLNTEEFREVISHFASGVTVITVLHEGERFGTTASAVTSLSLEPPMLLICMNKQSATGKAVAAAGHFAVNILGATQVELAKHFAKKGGDKFAGIDFSDGRRGDPLFNDVLATLECEVAEQTAVATHYVFMAEVVGGSASAGTPLAYFKGQFGRLELTTDQLEARVPSEDRRRHERRSPRRAP
ncbi:MAG: 4-nitrophenol 2-monooxygenase / 4-nitrocatechol 4-monooxygenase, reductase component [Thermoleophilaceae bacterium]|nr:4-nitrophenol 2-monooxygenase / 4-nitrocatechol 4-monooxygenase, reductase component [Thermoleophilaceae bacterium]